MVNKKHKDAGGNGVSFGLAFAIWLIGVGVLPGHILGYGFWGWTIGIYCAWALLPRALFIKQKGNNPGTVYVIKDRSTGLYKIGRTKNLERRMQELGVGKTADLVSSVEVGDMNAVEKAAHRRYKDKRLPQTEYFKLDRPPQI